MTPCTPPRWAPSFLSGLFCPPDGDGDGETVFVPRCANECPEPGRGCTDGQICVTQSGGGYIGSGNGLCVIDDSLPPPPEDLPATTGADAFDNDETWVRSPFQYQSGLGQCQSNENLVACCYLPDNFSDLPLIQQAQYACRANVPTRCSGNDICSTSGYCYERPDRNPGLIEPDLQRDQVDIHHNQAISYNLNRGLPMKIINRFGLLFSLFLISLFMSSVMAHNKVVVIPMSGDDLAPLKNIISVAKENGDFSDPIAAINSISNSSATNPYLIVIAPGVYDLGNDMLTLKPYVFVQGSGVDITTLESSPNDQDEATVTLVENSGISDISIESSANYNDDTYGVSATGENILLENCKIKATNSLDKGVGFALLEGDSDVIIDSVEFIVEGITSEGIGNSSAFLFSDLANLLIQNSIFRISSSTGTAITSTGQENDSSLIVKDTLIELLVDGSVGVSNTDGAIQLYDGLTIKSLADDVTAFRGAGSGFRPSVLNSSIILEGVNAIGFTSNNGSPRIQNTHLIADIGFKNLGTSSVFSPTFRIDNSVIDARPIIEIDNAGGSINVFIGSSKLDTGTAGGSNVLNQIQGTINANCINTYDRNYDALDTSCQ